MKIISVSVEHRRLSQGRVRLSLNESARARTEQSDALLVRVQTDAGLEGLGFTYLTGPGIAALRSLIETELAPLATGEDPLQTDRIYAKVQRAFLSSGFAGLTARAFAAIDFALWDLRGKAAGVPLFQLLGSARSSSPFFISDAAVLGRSASEAIDAAGPMLSEGAMGLLAEVGCGEIEKDGRLVEELREAVGEDGWLGITAGGRFDLATALAMAHFLEEDVGIDWFEHPLPVEDRKGYVRLAERMEVPLVLGTTLSTRDEFVRLLEIGDIRVLRPDLLRLGGITPFLKLAALAEAYPVTVVPHRLPEIGVHLACGLPNVPMVDYSSALMSLFAIPLPREKGRLLPPQQPGLGLAFA